MTSRGIRNNNPFNLDYNPAINWQGQTGIETGVPNPRFANFRTAVLGLRAGMRDLLTYQSKDGCRTLRQILNRFAPSSENNTAAYVVAICQAAAVGPDDEIDIDSSDLMLKVSKGIVVHENGENPYPDSTFIEAMHAAGIADAKPPPLATQRTFQAQVAGAATVVTAGAAQISSYAPTVKGWADQLGSYAGAPVIQHAITIMLTVAGGLAILGIVSQVLKQRAA